MAVANGATAGRSRGRASGGTRLSIGLITLETHAYSTSVFTTAVERAAREADVTLRVATLALLTPRAVERSFAQLVELDVDGVILSIPLTRVTERIGALTRGTPTVSVDGARTMSTATVAVDQVMAARLATQHLLNLGHATVWHISGPQDWSDATARSQGWRQTLVAAGIHPPPELPGDWSPSSGYQNGLVLGRMADATAVFVSSDEMAFGAIRALHQLGRSIPDSISIVSVDDIALAAYSSPPLTTVAQQFAETAELAVERLLAFIADPSTRPEPTVIEPQLVIRASTARPFSHP